jgi:hypothetical protein
MSSSKMHVLKIISLEDMINEQESMHQYGINNKLWISCGGTAEINRK